MFDFKNYRRPNDRATARMCPVKLVFWGGMGDGGYRKWTRTEAYLISFLQNPPQFVEEFLAVAREERDAWRRRSARFEQQERTMSLRSSSGSSTATGSPRPGSILLSPGTSEPPAPLEKLFKLLKLWDPLTFSSTDIERGIGVGIVTKLLLPLQRQLEV